MTYEEFKISVKMLNDQTFEYLGTEKIAVHAEINMITTTFKNMSHTVDGCARKMQWIAHRPSVYIPGKIEIRHANTMPTEMLDDMFKLMLAMVIDVIKTNS